MKAELISGALHIDGNKKNCPFQTAIPFQQPQSSLIAQNKQMEVGFIFQPCGPWCALFREIKINGITKKFDLRCAPVVYEVDESPKLKIDWPE